MPPGNGLIPAPRVIPKPKPVVIAPQNIGTPSAYHPPAPYTGNAFGNLGVEGSGYATSQNPAPPPAAAPAAAADAAPAAPAPTFDQLVEGDSEGKLQQGYLDSQNSLTTQALRRAWLMHTQGLQDSYNSHGGLFSGAAANAQKNATDDYNKQGEQQALSYSKSGHDIHSSVVHRLMLQLTGVDDGMGKN